MIGSGHMMQYMVRWGNLTKYSQQGWEALNALIKLFFFTRTNKGGGNSCFSADSKKSKLVPIGKLMQRRFFWVCNLVPTSLWKTSVNLNMENNMISSIMYDDDIIFDSEIIQQV